MALKAYRKTLWSNHFVDYSQCVPGTASSSPPPVTSPLSSSSNPTPTTPSSTASTPSGTATGPTPTGSQIRSDQDPAYHLYLQSVGQYFKIKIFYYSLN